MSGDSEALQTAITTSAVPRGDARRFAALAALTAVADWLFYGQNFGISLALFALLIFAAATAAHGAHVRPKNVLCLSLLLTITLLPIATGAGLISTSFAILGTAYAVVSLNDTTASFWPRSVSALRLLRGVLWRIVPDSYRAGAAFQPVVSHTWRPAALLAWVVPLLLGTIFVMLFADANPIIDSGLGALNPAIMLDGLSWSRACFWVLTASLVWPFLAAPTPPRPRASKAAQSAPAAIWAIVFGKSAILRALILFNLLFAVQTGLDACYLWAGHRLPGGLTYASYAHRGAYPLIFTALLAAAFAIIATKPETEAAKSRLTQALVLLWIAQNLQLVFSSILRLDLYVQAYSLTQLRLAALMWMLLVAAGLILILIRTAAKFSNAWLIRANLITAALVLYLSALMNVPGIVAMYDVKHCLQVSGQGTGIDLAYLQSLGPQAIPALDYFQTHAPGMSDWFAGVFAQSGAAGDVRLQLVDEFASDASDWRGSDFWSWELNRYLLTHQSR
jgi:hypothetical protein